MFKKIGIAVLVVTVLLAGMANVVLAQDATPPAATCPCGATGANFGQGGNGMRGNGYAGTMPTLLAGALGISTDELYAALADGQTVAEVATAQGVELADVVAAVVAPHAERVAQAVADGRLTQEQADTILATMTEHMTTRFQTAAGLGGGYGMQGGQPGQNGAFGGRGIHGGMRGGRWAAPQAPGN